VAPKEKVKEEMAECKPIFTVDIVSMQCAMHSPASDAVQQAPLVTGPDGLLVAKFGDTVHTTELCNLMLTAPPKKGKKRVKKMPAADMKKPAACDEIAKKPAAALKKPAADEEASMEEEDPEEEEKEEEEEAAAEIDLPDKEYGIMHYKINNTIGIRAKFGAQNQLFSFGGTKSTKTKEEMKAIAKQIVADLKTGVSVAAAKKRGNELAGV